MNVGTASKPLHPVRKVEPRYITINGKIARVEQRCADCARLVTRGAMGREVHAS